MIRLRLLGKTATTLRLAAGSFGRGVLPPSSSALVPTILKDESKFIKEFRKLVNVDIKKQLKEDYMREIPRGFIFELPEIRGLVQDFPKLAKSLDRYFTQYLPQMIFGPSWTKEVEGSEGITKYFNKPLNRQAIQNIINVLGNQLLSGETSRKRIKDFSDKEYRDPRTEKSTGEKKDIAERVETRAQKALNTFVEERPDTLWKYLEQAGVKKEEVQELVDDLVGEVTLPVDYSDEAISNAAKRIRKDAISAIVRGFERLVYNVFEVGAGDVTSFRELEEKTAQALKALQAREGSVQKYTDELFSMSYTSLISEARRTIGVFKDDHGTWQAPRLPNYAPPKMEFLQNMRFTIVKRIPQYIRELTAEQRDVRTTGGVVEGEEAESLLSKLHDLQEETRVVRDNLLEAQAESQDFMLLAHYLDNLDTLRKGPHPAHTEASPKAMEGTNVEDLQKTKNYHKDTDLTKARKVSSVLQAMVVTEQNRNKYYLWRSKQLDKLDDQLTDLYEERNREGKLDSYNFNAAFELLDKAKQLLGPGAGDIGSTNTFKNQFTSQNVHEALDLVYQSYTIGQKFDKEGKPVPGLFVLDPIFKTFRSHFFSEELPSLVKRWFKAPKLKKQELMTDFTKGPKSLATQFEEQFFKGNVTEVSESQIFWDDKEKYKDLLNLVRKFRKDEGRPTSPLIITREDITVVRDRKRSKDQREVLYNPTRDPGKQASIRARTGSTLLRQMFRLFLQEPTNV